MLVRRLVTASYDAESLVCSLLTFVPTYLVSQEASARCCCFPSWVSSSSSSIHLPFLISNVRSVTDCVWKYGSHRRQVLQRRNGRWVLAQRPVFRNNTLVFAYIKASRSTILNFSRKYVILLVNPFSSWCSVTSSSYLAGTIECYEMETYTVLQLLLSSFILPIVVFLFIWRVMYESCCCLRWRHVLWWWQSSLSKYLTS